MLGFDPLKYEFLRYTYVISTFLRMDRGVAARRSIVRLITRANIYLYIYIVN